VEQVNRLLAVIGENTLTKGEREMNDLLPKNERDISNQFRGDMAIRRKALEKVLMNKYMKYYEDILDSGELDEHLPIMKEIRKKEEKDDEVKKSDFMLITFAPKDLKMNPLELIKYMERIVKFSFIKQYIYVLEQRYSGDPDEDYKELGSGIHSHLFIDKGNYRFSHTQRDIKRVFKSITCNIDFKNVKDTAVSIQNTNNYLLGDKKDKHKQLRQVQDRIWREREGIKAYYGAELNLTQGGGTQP